MNECDGMTVNKNRKKERKLMFSNSKVGWVKKILRKSIEIKKLISTGHSEFVNVFTFLIFVS